MGLRGDLAGVPHLPGDRDVRGDRLGPRDRAGAGPDRRVRRGLHARLRLALRPAVAGLRAAGRAGPRHRHDHRRRGDRADAVPRRLLRRSCCRPRGGRAPPSRWHCCHCSRWWPATASRRSSSSWCGRSSSAWCCSGSSPRASSGPTRAGRRWRWSPSASGWRATCTTSWATPSPALSIKAELAGRLIDVDPERARAELASIQETARQALAEVRATVGGLRASNLEAELEAAPRVLADAGIETVVHGEVADTDPRHRALLAWALREAVTNVVRHAARVLGGRRPRAARHHCHRRRHRASRAPRATACAAWRSVSPTPAAPCRCWTPAAGTRVQVVLP